MIDCRLNCLQEERKCSCALVSALSSFLGTVISDVVANRAQVEMAEQKVLGIYWIIYM